METQINKKSNKMAALTLVFAIVAALFLFISAAFSVVITAVDVTVPLLFAFARDIISAIFSAISPMVIALATVLAALFLLINRKGALPFLPFGFLGGAVVHTIIAIPLNSIINYILSKIFHIYIFDIVLNLTYSLSGIILCLVIMAIVFVIAIFIKKYRFILMIVLSVGFLVTSVASIFFTVLGIIGNVAPDMWMLEYLDFNTKVIVVWNSMIFPILNCLTMPILTVGSIFAIFAVLPYYKTEKVVSAEAPEAVAEPEAQAEAPEAVAESEENAKVEYDFSKGI